MRACSSVLAVGLHKEKEVNRDGQFLDEKQRGNDVIHNTYIWAPSILWGGNCKRDQLL